MATDCLTRSQRRRRHYHNQHVHSNSHCVCPSLVASVFCARAEDAKPEAGGVRGTVLFERKDNSGKTTRAVLERVLIYERADAAVEKKEREPVVVRVADGKVVPAHAVAVVGQKLIVEEPESGSHNIAIPGITPPAIRSKNEPLEVICSKPGDDYRLQCAIDPAVVGMITVVPTPRFAWTDEKGAFTLLLPPGKHKIRAFHAEHGGRTVEVTVREDGSSKPIEIVLSAK
jgi:hypothetical protein